MAEIVFWTIAALTIMSAAFVVLNSQLIYSAVALLFTLFGVGGEASVPSAIVFP